MSSKYRMTDISQENLDEQKAENKMSHTTGPLGFAAGKNSQLEKLKNSEHTGSYLPGIYNQ